MGNKRIAIVGAGLAGLTAALAARKLGLEVGLFEQAADFKQIGGGIMIHSNGMRVLEALDLLDGFAPHMRLTPLIHLEAPHGKRLSTTDFREVTIPHNRAAVVMRYRLQEYLLEAAQRAGVQVHFGHRLMDLSCPAERAVLRFAGGAEEEFDVVIAGDGLHSQTRRSSGLAAAETALGKAYVRGISEFPSKESDVRELWGPGGRLFGICPLPGDRTYFFCTVPLGGWQDILSNRREEWIASWESFGPDVVAILRAVPDWSRVNYSELFRVKMERWYRPPVFVIGDAAHAMAPNLGQGANSAMVDSLVLMRLLARALPAGGSLEPVGRTYDELRRPFVTRIQKTAGQLNTMAETTSLPTRLLRKTAIFVMNHVGVMRRRGILLAAGYNPQEEQYLNGTNGQ